MVFWLQLLRPTQKKKKKKKSNIYSKKREFSLKIDTNEYKRIDNCVSQVAQNQISNQMLLFNRNLENKYR